MDPGHSVSRMTKGEIDSEDSHDSIPYRFAPGLQNDNENDFQNENEIIFRMTAVMTGWVKLTGRTA